MGDDALFEIPDGARVAKPAPESPRSLRERQMDKMLRGLHPLSAPGRPIWLHKDAPRPADPRSPGPRCETCAFRELLQAENWKRYPKCTHPAHGSHLSHSTATDVRSWWPACREYEPKTDQAGEPGETTA